MPSGCFTIMSNRPRLDVRHGGLISDNGSIACFPCFFVVQAGRRQKLWFCVVAAGGGVQVNTNGMPMRDSSCRCLQDQGQDGLCRVSTRDIGRAQRVGMSGPIARLSEGPRRLPCHNMRRYRAVAEAADRRAQFA